jgi:hypothetical protein
MTASGASDIDVSVSAPLGRGRKGAMAVDVAREVQESLLRALRRDLDATWKPKRAFGKSKTRSAIFLMISATSR